MSGEEIVDAEILEDVKPRVETRIVQVTPELEIERLKTKRAELATERVKRRWETGTTALVMISAFASCAHCINPW